MQGSPYGSGKRPEGQNQRSRNAVPKAVAPESGGADAYNRVQDIFGMNTLRRCTPTNKIIGNAIQDGTQDAE